jgi:hypothetical protein
VVASAIAVEFQEQLLARERELDSREGTLTTWENGLVASKSALGRACMERNIECAQANAARSDYQARILIITVGCQHSFNFD